MRDQKHRSPLGSGNAAQRFALAGLALGEARKKNREQKWPVVLEGKRDRAALETLGFVGPLEILNKHKPDAVRRSCGQCQRKWPIKNMCERLRQP